MDEHDAKRLVVLIDGRRAGVVTGPARARPGPLRTVYDVASALPYDDMYLPRLRLAMRIGGEYRVGMVGARHWRRFAATNGLPVDATLERIDRLAERVPASFAEAARADAVRALRSGLPARLVERVSTQASQCRTALAEG